MIKKHVILILAPFLLMAGCQNIHASKPVSKQQISKEYCALEAARLVGMNAARMTTIDESTQVVSTRTVTTDSAIKKLDTKEYDWYFKVPGKGQPPEGPNENSFYKSDKNCFYIGDSSKKYIYLTFDQGYENGYTSKILDILKKHHVKAAFFCVKPYMTANPELIKRMVEEGHLVCNHSSHHPSMAKITDYSKFTKELSEVEEVYKQLTGKEMPKYFRPPMGKYSELSLKYTQDYGYKTVFWSLAYMDWLPEKQPTADFAKKKLLGRMHNGAIVLLHSVSKTNAEILDDLIVELEKQGYEFKTLDDLK